MTVKAGSIIVSQFNPHAVTLQDTFYFEDRQNGQPIPRAEAQDYVNQLSAVNSGTTDNSDERASTTPYQLHSAFGISDVPGVNITTVKIHYNDDAPLGGEDGRNGNLGHSFTDDTQPIIYLNVADATNGYSAKSGNGIGVIFAHEEDHNMGLRHYPEASNDIMNEGYGLKQTTGYILLLLAGGQNSFYHTTDVQNLPSDPSAEMAFNLNSFDSEFGDIVSIFGAPYLSGNVSDNILFTSDASLFSGAHYKTAAQRLTSLR